MINQLEQEEKQMDMGEGEEEGGKEEGKKDEGTGKSEKIQEKQAKKRRKFIVKRGRYHYK